jgi:hypothetical protein
MGLRNEKDKGVLTKYCANMLDLADESASIGSNFVGLIQTPKDNLREHG